MLTHSRIDTHIPTYTFMYTLTCRCTYMLTHAHTQVQINTPIVVCRQMLIHIQDTHTYTFIYTDTLIYKHTLVYRNTCIHIHTHMDTHTHEYVLTCMSRHTCSFTCIQCTYTHVTYRHTFTHTHAETCTHAYVYTKSCTLIDTHVQ